MRMTDTKDQALAYVRALVYGDSGIGKTSSLKTLPADRTLIAAAERDLLPLAGLDYKVATIDTWDDVRELLKLCHTSPLTVDGRKISALAIDSLTQLSDLCVRQIVAVDRKALISERTKGKADAPQGIYDDLMSQEDWNLYGTRMANMLDAFCHLPLHIIFTSLAGWTEDKKAGSLYRGPLLYGKTATKAPAWFGMVFYMEAVEQVNAEGQKVNARVWRTFNDGTAVAKDSTGKLDAYELPDWTKLIRKVLPKTGGSK